MSRRRSLRIAAEPARAASVRRVGTLGLLDQALFSLWSLAFSLLATIWGSLGDVAALGGLLLASQIIGLVCRSLFSVRVADQICRGSNARVAGQVALGRTLGLSLCLAGMASLVVFRLGWCSGTYLAAGTVTVAAAATQDASRFHSMATKGPIAAVKSDTVVLLCLGMLPILKATGHYSPVTAALALALACASGVLVSGSLVGWRLRLGAPPRTQGEPSGASGALLVATLAYLVGWFLIYLSVGVRYGSDAVGAMRSALVPLGVIGLISQAGTMILQTQGPLSFGEQRRRIMRTVSQASVLASIGIAVAMWGILTASGAHVYGAKWPQVHQFLSALTVMAFVSGVESLAAARLTVWGRANWVGLVRVGCLPVLVPFLIVGSGSTLPVWGFASYTLTTCLIMSRLLRRQVPAIRGLMAIATPEEGRVQASC
jgi:hypothetical protein